MKLALAPLALAAGLLAAVPSAPLSAQTTQPARNLGVAAAGKTVDLPVTRAVLFSSGVGYFEHTGTVDGDAVMRLNFKTDQINDMLKSMVLTDEGGGHVSSVTYPSNDPIARSLKSFGVDLSANPTLPQLLNQLRGAQVTVTAPEKLTGSILNVETVTKVIGQPPTQVTEHVLTLVTETGIRTLPLSSVSSVTLGDPKLQEELNKALALLVSSRDTDRKPVDVRFEAGDAKGPRRVRVGYLVESPVWKTSYRLDLSDLAPAPGNPGAVKPEGTASSPGGAAAGKGGPKAFVQGWAIVENTSDADWQNVGLSLVSGRPISFVMDLYTPLYLDRPVVVPPMFASLRPRVYEEGIDRQMAERVADASSGKRDAAAGRARRGLAGGGGGSPSEAAADKVSLRATNGVEQRLEDAEQSNAPAATIARLSGDRTAIAQASGSGLGELFQFTLRHPVDMPRRRSAMLPIINQPIGAEKVSIYNQAVLPTRPLNGLYLTNDTGLKMLAGPVTVFDAGAYAGDAQIDHLATGDKRLLSYSVDLALTVDPSVTSTQAFVSGTISRGVLYLTHRTTFTHTYTIKSKADLARQVIVEHPFVNGRELLEPKAFEEKTPALYRFRVPVEAGKTETLKVVEQQPVSQGIALLGQSPETLLVYVRNGEIAQKVRDAIAKAAQMKRELTDLQRQQAELQKELAGYTPEQERLRQNIATAGKDSPQGQRWLTKLSQQEDRIEQVQKTLAELQKQIEAKTKELAEYVEHLEVS